MMALIVTYCHLRRWWIKFWSYRTAWKYSATTVTFGNYHTCEFSSEAIQCYMTPLMLLFSGETLMKGKGPPIPQTKYVGGFF